MILTVALTETKRTAFIKNLPLFARLSKGFPDWIFKIVGVNKDFHPWLYELGGDNLVIEERMEFNDLLKEYQKAKVYCQLSIREGLPNALCEAMMCGCIPVGSNINGIPKAIGDCGFLCSVGDINAAEKAIDQAILSNLDERGRDRIIELFSTPKRAVRIKELMESL